MKKNINNTLPVGKINFLIMGLLITLLSATFNLNVFAQDTTSPAEAALPVSKQADSPDYEEIRTDLYSGYQSINLITATTYSFTSQTGVALEDMSSGTTQLAAPLSDDTASPLQNIGFDFWYDGVRFTQFGSNGNGFIKLGATTGSAFTNDLDSTTESPKIAAFWDDLCVGSNGSVRYKTIGTAPNRKMIVEYQNMKITRSSVPTGCVGVGTGTFQIWLFESAGTTTPGLIQFVYGAIPAAPDNSGYSVGLQSGAATNVASDNDFDRYGYIRHCQRHTTKRDSGGKILFVHAEYSGSTVQPDFRNIYSIHQHA